MAVEDVKDTMLRDGDFYVGFYNSDVELIGTLHADGSFETGKL